MQLGSTIPAQSAVGVQGSRQSRNDSGGCTCKSYLFHLRGHEAPQVLLIFPLTRTGCLLFTLFCPLASFVMTLCSQNECFFISALLAEVKARWTSHLCWTKHLNTFVAAVASVDSAKVQLMSLFWNIFMVSEKISITSSDGKIQIASSSNIPEDKS